ncbi:hypothetical protein EJ06DRAFT_525458 [Trichodelitschia bisporula]|uniref:Uncharacterized protein n=1 Tax=Trichodelitschia bisporula TaxID=703511 RepID=A0A6G1I9B7_9PEZI|nr:hypothetical protein EJ06DRAFT_525458 [Trichodelitschia bisporula]
MVTPSSVPTARISPRSAQLPNPSPATTITLPAGSDGMGTVLVSQQVVEVVTAMSYISDPALHLSARSADLPDPAAPTTTTFSAGSDGVGTVMVSEQVAQVVTFTSYTFDPSLSLSRRSAGFPTPVPTTTTFPAGSDGVGTVMVSEEVVKVVTAMSYIPNPTPLITKRDYPNPAPITDGTKVIQPEAQATSWVIEAIESIFVYGPPRVFTSLHWPVLTPRSAHPATLAESTSTSAPPEGQYTVLYIQEAVEDVTVTATPLKHARSVRFPDPVPPSTVTYPLGSDRVGTVMVEEKVWDVVTATNFIAGPTGTAHKRSVSPSPSTPDDVPLETLIAVGDAMTKKGPKVARAELPPSLVPPPVSISVMFTKTMVTPHPTTSVSDITSVFTSTTVIKVPATTVKSTTTTITVPTVAVPAVTAPTVAAPTVHVGTVIDVDQMFPAVIANVLKLMRGARPPPVRPVIEVVEEDSEDHWPHELVQHTLPAPAPISLVPRSPAPSSILPTILPSKSALNNLEARPKKTGPLTSSEIEDAVNLALDAVLKHTESPEPAKVQASRHAKRSPQVLETVVRDAESTPEDEAKLCAKFAIKDLYNDAYMPMPADVRAFVHSGEDATPAYAKDYLKSQREHAEGEHGPKTADNVKNAAKLAVAKVYEVAGLPKPVAVTVLGEVTQVDLKLAAQIIVEQTYADAGLPMPADVAAFVESGHIKRSFEDLKPSDAGTDPLTTEEVRLAAKMAAANVYAESHLLMPAEIKDFYYSQKDGELPVPKFDPSVWETDFATENAGKNTTKHAVADVYEYASVPMPAEITEDDVKHAAKLEIEGTYEEGDMPMPADVRDFVDSRLVKRTPEDLKPSDAGTDPLTKEEVKLAAKIAAVDMYAEVHLPTPADVKDFVDSRENGDLPLPVFGRTGWDNVPAAEDGGKDAAKLAVADVYEYASVPVPAEVTEDDVKQAAKFEIEGAYEEAGMPMPADVREFVDSRLVKRSPNNFESTGGGDNYEVTFDDLKQVAKNTILSFYDDIDLPMPAEVEDWVDNRLVKRQDNDAEPEFTEEERANRKQQAFVDVDIALKKMFEQANLPVPTGLLEEPGAPLPSRTVEAVATTWVDEEVAATGWIDENLMKRNTESRPTGEPILVKRGDDDEERPPWGPPKEYDDIIPRLHYPYEMPTSDWYLEQKSRQMKHWAKALLKQQQYDSTHLDKLADEMVAQDEAAVKDLEPPEPVNPNIAAEYKVSPDEVSQENAAYVDYNGKDAEERERYDREIALAGIAHGPMRITTAQKLDHDIKHQAELEEIHRLEKEGHRTLHRRDTLGHDHEESDSDDEIPLSPKEQKLQMLQDPKAAEAADKARKLEENALQKTQEAADKKSAKEAKKAAKEVAKAAKKEQKKQEKARKKAEKEAKKQRKKEEKARKKVQKAAEKQRKKDEKQDKKHAKDQAKADKAAGKKRVKDDWSTIYHERLEAVCNDVKAKQDRGEELPPTPKLFSWPPHWLSVHDDYVKCVDALIVKYPRKEMWGAEARAQWMKKSNATHAKQEEWWKCRDKGIEHEGTFECGPMPPNYAGEPEDGGLEYYDKYVKVDPEVYNLLHTRLWKENPKPTGRYVRAT